jgi:hypothetical protein
MPDDRRPPAERFSEQAMDPGDLGRAIDSAWKHQRAAEGFRSPVSPHPPEKSVERPDEPLPQADGDPGPPTYASHTTAVDTDWSLAQSRCSICSEPFIYGWGNPLTENFRKNEDVAVQTDEGDWIHTACKEKI